MGIQINGQTDTVTAIDGSLNVGGDVTIPGVLTYDDVTNIDSVGIVTARSGIHITGGSVGIGTDNPTAPLQINHASPKIILRDNDNDADISVANIGGAAVYSAASDVIFQTLNTSEKLRITSAGKVGINTNNPLGDMLTVCEFNSGTEIYENIALRLQGSSGQNVALQFTDTTGAAAYVAVQGDALRLGTDNAERLRITSGGDTEIRNTVVGVTDAYSQSLKFRTTQTNGQSAITGAIAAQGKASWGGDLVFYTKEANATPNDTVRETLRIDTAGRITKPYQPRFFTYATSSIAVTSAGYRTVDIWNQTRFNVGSHFSTSTNKFIAPIAGCYLFGTQVRLDAADTGYFRLILSVNDSTADNEQGHSITDTGSTGNQYHTMAVTALYELSAGQSVKVVVEGNTDSSYTIQSESQFWGYLVA